MLVVFSLEEDKDTSIFCSTNFDEQATGYATQNSAGSYDFTFAFTAYNQEKVKNGSLAIQK